MPTEIRSADFSLCASCPAMQIFGDEITHMSWCASLKTETPKHCCEMRCSDPETHKAVWGE